ncbi:Inosose dehydratase [Planctomycetes bacterium Pan216]|uniref:Inosose dehydratase n=1 Tax=Kolteria novifilia TaxID=2527975 RepID=A0A518BBL7_9BACT|nr:Inosose dehydratase [Planctomycetes bacterium Pan216]
MPKLAAFPKAYMDALCIDGSMRLEEWIELGAKLDIDGLEFYSGLLDLKDPSRWATYRKMAADHGLAIPMLCCSPDFTHPDAAFRRKQVEQEKHWITMAAELGATYCRVLSGQRRPEVGREEGIGYAAECIEACLPHAESVGVTLIIENHYKDNYWTYPEFAQYADVFCDLIAKLDSPHFGVNYDPSNTLLAGEDPIELLERVKRRVVTMHASDRFLTEGTWDDLRREEMNVEGYAARLSHGEIGQGLNDYDKIFSILAGEGFDGWISIEDGVDGFEQLKRSVAFLKGKMAQHWPATS